MSPPARPIRGGLVIYPLSLSGEPTVFAGNHRALDPREILDGSNVHQDSSERAP